MMPDAITPRPPPLAAIDGCRWLMPPAITR